MAKKTTRKAAKRSPAKKASKAAPRKASKKAPAKKRTPARKAPAKKSPARKKGPAKKTGTSHKQTRGTPSKSRSKKAPKTAYEKRNASAKEKGFGSYWDERQSRIRAREALDQIGHPDANATDKATLRDVDELATLGRGESARELYYKTRKILEKYEPAPSDSQIWSLIRIFYKPRGRR
jgi:hypothetical protein